MRIYQNNKQLVQAADTSAQRVDDWTVEVTASGLDANGDLETLRLQLSVNEARTIANAAGKAYASARSVMDTLDW